VTQEAKLPIRRSVDTQAKNDQAAKQRIIPTKPEPAILPVRRSAIDNNSTPKINTLKPEQVLNLFLIRIKTGKIHLYILEESSTNDGSSK